MFLLQNESNRSHKTWQSHGEGAIFRVFFWVVMPCVLLDENERLENIDSIFSADVSIVGIWQIV
jgi:hypothetical protein